MATLNVIYKIAADISGLQSGVNRAATSMESLESKASIVGRTLAGMFTVGAVVAFGKELLDTADSLEKLSDKTSIGVEELQRLQAVAQDSGNTLEEVANAVNQMQRRIGEGAPKTAAALNEIGLSIAELKALSPDEQFFAIAKAIAAIKDPTEQMAVGVALMGKGFAQVLPTIKADIDKLKDSTVTMSKENVKALDDLGDSMGRLWTSSKNALGGMVGWLVRAGSALEQFKANLLSGGTLNQHLAAMAALEQASKNAPKGAGMAPIAVSPIGADEAVAALNEGLKEQVKRVDASAEAWRRNQAALEKYRAAVEDVLTFSEGFGAVLDTVDGNVLAGIRYYVERGKSLSDLGAIYGLTKQQVEALNEQFKFEQSVVDATTKSFGGFSRQIQIALPTVSGLTEEMTYLESTVLPSFNVELPKAVGGIQDLSKAERTAAVGARTLSDSLRSLAHLDLKAVFGDIVNFFKNGIQDIGRGVLEGFGQGLLNGVTALIGKGLGALWNGLKGLFGNNAEKQINPIRQGFIDAAGGLAVLNQRAAEAGVTLRDVLNAKTPEAYKKAIDELNAALQFQDDAMAKLDETVKKYGFSLEELGPALQRQNIDKQAQELYQDFKVLTSAGIDTDVVLGRMGDSINDFVHAALKTGTEIPAAMAPMLQRMVELGQLTDENGNVITDLEASGVHFSETMTQGFQKIVDAVTKLTDAITRGLGLAIQSIPDPEVTGTVHWNVDDLPDIHNDFPRDIPALAEGGIVNRPTLALIGESGPEAVVPLRRGAAPPSDPPSGETHVHIHIGDEEIGMFALNSIIKGGKTFGKFRTMVKAAA